MRAASTLEPKTVGRRDHRPAAHSIVARRDHRPAAHSIVARRDHRPAAHSIVARRDHRPAAHSIVGLAVLVAAFAGCHSPGAYGHSKIYAPNGSEEKAVSTSKEYDAREAERAGAKPRDQSVWLFGVVTNRGSGPGGAAYVTLSLRTLQQRNLCESEDEETCRVTVSEREMGRAHALLALAAEDDMGQDSVGLGSLLRVVGKVTQDLDPSDGTPVLRAAFYRHWPRGSFVTTKAASVMKR